MKILSLPKHENLTTGNKIVWQRGEIAPKEQFLLFSTIFSIHLYLQESNYIYICYMWLFELFLPQFCKSDMVRISQSISESPFEFEITRADCINFRTIVSNLSRKQEYMCPQYQNIACGTKRKHKQTMTYNKQATNQRHYSERGQQTKLVFRKIIKSIYTKPN